MLYRLRPLQLCCVVYGDFCRVEERMSSILLQEVVGIGGFNVVEQIVHGPAWVEMMYDINNNVKTVGLFSGLPSGATHILLLTHLLVWTLLLWLFLLSPPASKREVTPSVDEESMA